MSDDDSEWEEAEQNKEASEEEVDHNDESFHGDDSDSSEEEDNNEKPKARPRSIAAKKKTTTTTTKKRKPVSKKADATATRKRKKSAAAAAAANDDEEEEEEDKTATTATTTTPTKRIDNRKRLRRVDFESLDDTIDYLPSHDRLTDRGGYMHTKTSRMKISEANSGNVPWNAGKNRSAEDKAKISAAVRARNRAILIIKLDTLGMAEDEWLAKKRKIKLLREKVRKARVAAKSHVEKAINNAQQKKQKASKKGVAGQVGLGSEMMEALLESDVDEEEEDEDEASVGEGEVS